MTHLICNPADATAPVTLSCKHPCGAADDMSMAYGGNVNGLVAPPGQKNARRSEAIPPDRAVLYVSLSRTAEILDVSVEAINRLRNDSAHGFPRKYNFDRPAEHGRPAIKRGPFFRHDEIQRWQQRQGDSGSRGDPPDKRETAALAGNRRDGSDQFCTLNFTGPDEKKQGTPCAKCALYDGANLRVLHRQRATLGRDCDVLVKPSSGRKWSSCQLAATRDPGAHCHFFQSRRGRAANG